jgi:DNA-binding CsgD family transcriptional regulator
MTLAALILLQSLCALFFMADVMIDLNDGDHLDHIQMLLEAIAALALSGGVIFLMLELRRLLARMDTMATGLRAARGEMAELLDGFFERWALTPSERDVALMVLKGVDNETIASLRGTATGTVRAQCTRIYAKAGVDGRSQLFSIFMEELLAGDHPLDPSPDTPAMTGAGRENAPAGGNRRGR